MFQNPNLKNERKKEVDEKKEFLKRTEIRTMAKDVTELRKIETEKEKQRIMGLLPKETKKEKIEPVFAPMEKQTLMPKPLSKKSFLSKKILPRAIFVLIILFILGFVFWLIGAKTAPSKEPFAPEIIPATEEEIEVEKEIEEEIIEEPETPTVPLITERILDWGFHIPSLPRTIDTIIVHSIYNDIGGDVHSLEQVIQEYKMYRVTAHYLIARDGVIYRTASDNAIAYHAGISKMPVPDNRINVNDFSIGIEIINTKTESPTEDQYQSLIQLVKYLQEEYNIPSANILGHKDIAPERKTDPWNFDWEYFQSLI